VESPSQPNIAHHWRRGKGAQKKAKRWGQENSRKRTQTRITRMNTDEENPKHQHPSSREAPNSNFQSANCAYGLTVVIRIAKMIPAKALMMKRVEKPSKTRTFFFQLVASLAGCERCKGTGEL